MGDGQWLVHNCNPFDDLARMRQELGLPPAGSLTDKSTIARLDIGGESFYGINGHGQKITVSVNNITKTHAEADALQQAINSGIKADTATIYVDRALCAACGQNGGLRSIVEQMGLKELKVVTPEGIQVIRPRPGR